MNALVTKSENGGTLLTEEGVDRAMEICTAGIEEWFTLDSCADALAGTCAERFSVIHLAALRWLGWFELERQLGLIAPDDSRIHDAILVALLRDLLSRVLKAEANV